jgi:hypothetical protein
MSESCRFGMIVCSGRSNVETIFILQTGITSSKAATRKHRQQHLRAAFQPPSAVNLHQSRRNFHQHPPGPNMKVSGSRICVALVVLTFALYAQSTRAASCLFTPTECQCSESVSASKCVHVVSKKGNQHMCEAGACSAGFRCVRPLSSRQKKSFFAQVLRQPTDHALPFCFVVLSICDNACPCAGI